MTGPIRLLFELTIADKQVNTVKELLSAAVEIVQAKDSGAMDYEFYFDEEGTKVYAVERYKDSEAVMAHLGIVGETLTKLLEVASITRAEVFGNPSSEVLQALEPFKARVFRHCGGFSR